MKSYLKLFVKESLKDHDKLLLQRAVFVRSSLTNAKVEAIMVPKNAVVISI
jgi:hypothetical protein